MQNMETRESPPFFPLYSQKWQIIMVSILPKSQQIFFPVVMNMHSLKKSNTDVKYFPLNKRSGAFCHANEESSIPWF